MKKYTVNDDNKSEIQQRPKKYTEPKIIIIIQINTNTE